MKSFQSSAVEQVFRGYPNELRAKLMRLRQLIFERAAGLEGVGPLDETLKWGQPSYLTSQSKSGTTIRVDQNKSKPGQYCLFVHCQTSLLATYREFYADVLRFGGKRCVEFNADEDPPEDALRRCIELALTYHRHKRRDGLPF